MDTQTQHYVDICIRWIESHPERYGQKELLQDMREFFAHNIPWNIGAKSFTDEKYEGLAEEVAKFVCWDGPIEYEAPGWEIWESIENSLYEDAIRSLHAEQIAAKM